MDEKQGQHSADLAEALSRVGQQYPYTDPDACRHLAVMAAEIDRLNQVLRAIAHAAWLRSVGELPRRERVGY